MEGREEGEEIKRRMEGREEGEKKDKEKNGGKK